MNHQVWQFKGWLQSATAPAAKQDLQDSSTLFWARPGMSENVMAVGDARWIGGLTKVVIYLTLKGCSLCHSNTVVWGIQGGKLPG